MLTGYWHASSVSETALAQVGPEQPHRRWCLRACAHAPAAARPRPQSPCFPAHSALCDQGHTDTVIAPGVQADATGKHVERATFVRSSGPGAVTS